jgi:hypothetical protein
VLAVHDEVDGDLAALGVDLAHGVGAHGRALVRRQFPETVQGERLRQRGDVDARVDDDHLHVGIGVLVGGEGGAAAEDDADHVRCQLLGAHHLEGVNRTSCHSASIT